MMTNSGREGKNPRRRRPNRIRAPRRKDERSVARQHRDVQRISWHAASSASRLTAHRYECGDSRYLAIPFLDACLAARLPDKGSKDQTLKPMDARQGVSSRRLIRHEACQRRSSKANRNEAIWLPNEVLAKAWMEYVKTGRDKRHHARHPRRST